MDFALPMRAALIAGSESKQTRQMYLEAKQAREADGLALKRERAKRYLGARWVLHPAYLAERNPHHSPAFKTSAVLTAFCNYTGAYANGRV